jgi:hypothetical protein
MLTFIRRIFMALTFTSEDQATLKELLAGGGKSAAAVKALQDENAAQQAALDAITQAVRDAKLDGNATTEAVAEILTDTPVVEGEVVPGGL